MSPGGAKRPAGGPVEADGPVRIDVAPAQRREAVLLGRAHARGLRPVGIGEARVYCVLGAAARCLTIRCRGLSTLRLVAATLGRPRVVRCSAARSRTRAGAGSSGGSAVRPPHLEAYGIARRNPTSHRPRGRTWRGGGACGLGRDHGRVAERAHGPGAPPAPPGAWGTPQPVSRLESPRVVTAPPAPPAPSYRPRRRRVARGRRPHRRRRPSGRWSR